MNKFLTLTKVLFKNGGEGLVQKDKKKLPKTIALIVLMVVAFLPMMGSFVMMAAASYGAFAKMGQEGLILEMGIIAACFIIFVFGIFYVMSTFYFSTDVEKLLPLPLKPSMIIGSKFTVVMLYEYLTMLVFLLPIMVTFGVMSKAGILYYLYMILIFLAIPVVPLVVASLISMLIMRFLPFAKNKDAFRTIAGILGLGIGIGCNIVFQKLGSSTENPEQLVQLMMQGNNSLVGTSSKLFPSAKLAVNAMLYSGELKGLVNLILFFVVSIALILILLILGEALYFKGAIGISEASSKRRKLSKRELEESTVQSSSLKSYTVKELKILFRTPAYFMNCVLMNFLFPVIFLIPFFSQPQMMSELGKVRDVLNSNSVPGIVIGIIFGFMMFISVANPTSTTSISREGQNIFVCKYLPISYKKQIMAKVLSGIILNFIGLGLMIIVAMVILVPPVYLLIQVIIIAVLVSLFANFIGILIDLNFPKLQWDTEQRAVKQNMNVLILMLLGFIIGGISVAAVAILGLKLWTAFGTLAGIYLVLDILLYWILSTAGVKMFSKIQA